MSDQWNVEPPAPGILGRLLVPQSSAKPAGTAFVVGLAGVGAFVASLALDWQKITVLVDLTSSSTSFSSSRTSAPDTIVLNAGLGSIDVLGLVYILGSLGLLVILGSVLTRPDVALRMRMGAAGLGVGVLGVLVALVQRLPETVFNVQGVFGGISSQTQQEMLDHSNVAYDVGMFAAFGAVVLLSGAVWLAAAPAARQAAAAAAWAAAYPGYYPGYPAHPYPTYPGGYPAQGAYPVAPTGHPGNGAAGNADLVPASGVPAADSQVSGPAGAYRRGPYPAAPVSGPASPPVAPPPVASTWQPPSRVGHVDGLSVTASDPLDPGTATDVWRR